MAGGSGQAGQHTREEKTRGIEGTEKSIAPPGGLKLRCNGGGKHEKRYEPHSKSVRQPAAGAVAGVEPAPTRAGRALVARPRATVKPRGRDFLDPRFGAIGLSAAPAGQCFQWTAPDA